MKDRRPSIANVTEDVINEPGLGWSCQEGGLSSGQVDRLNVDDHGDDVTAGEESMTSAARTPATV